MNKRIQFVPTDEALAAIDSALKEVNSNNKLGHITISDLVCEMILTSKVDTRLMQLKHADVRKTLRSYAADKELDLKAIIKNLTELQAKISKPPTKQTSESDGKTL